MNKESLERLLIDRALGELSPEVDELLNEQLGANPEKARIATEFMETVTLARALIKRPAAMSAFRPPLRATVRRRRVTRVFAMAASFALGAAVTFWATRTATAPVVRNVTFSKSAPATSRPTSAAAERAVRTLPFWSNQRIYALASAARQPTIEKEGQ